MDNWQSLIQHLLQQLEQLKTMQPLSDIQRLQATFEPNVQLLSWLKAQTLYPQFYLHLRAEQAEKHREKWLALGQIRCFESLAVAQAFIQQGDFRLFGGLTFDGNAYFYLPRLLVQQQGKQWHISLFIDHQQDWQKEYQTAQEMIKTLENKTALLPVQQPIQRISQQADKAQWCRWVEKALDAIQRGELSKVVLANESQFQAENPINAVDVLAESEQYHQGCYHFLFAQDNQQYFIGSTPERLYWRQGNQLDTEALAGTALMSADPVFNQQQADWLLQDEKNDYENRLVAEGICNNLQAYVQQIAVSQVELKQLRQVQHLRRNIRATLLPQVGDAQCLRAIHPTAAIAGLPPQKAQQFLAQTENFQRSWYAGTLGTMSATQAEFCVTIRSAFICDKLIRVFAGAGIVAGSQAELEWQEIERKAAGLLSLIQPHLTTE